MSYGIIFITAEEKIMGGEVYDYKDLVLTDEFDSSKIFLSWCGQKRGRRDHIVIEDEREIHVCARKKKSDPYTYYGVVVRDTIRRVVTGNHDEGVPHRYFMALTTGRLPMRTILSGELSPQRQAVQTLGFDFSPSYCGIYEVYEHRV